MNDSTSAALISLRNVNVALNGRYVLHNISWELKRGANWAVLGPNGAGKSTFLRLLRGEVWPAPINGGTRIYHFDGQSTESAIGIKNRMAVVSAELQQRYVRAYQRKYGDDFGPGLTAQDIVFTGLLDSELVTRKPNTAERQLVACTLQRVGISDLAEAQFDKLSQGELRKVLIARAVIGDPMVLILDEVGVGLDQRSRLQLLDLAQRVAENGTQILCTTHRRDELIPAITNVMELRNGRVYKAGKAAGMQTTNGGRQTAKWRTFIMSAAPRRQSSEVGVHLNIRNASVAVAEGAKLVLHNINWRMNVGEHWMILGDNGVGKSTLLKLILGELWPSADSGGSIERFGHKDFRDVWEIKKRIGYVSCEFQTRYFVDLPAEKVIASGFFASVGWLQPTTKAQDKRVREVIKQFGLEPLAQRSILAMSYGQARKVLVARALVNNPKLLVLDEVFDGLDAQFRAELRQVFEALAQPGTDVGTGIILVSHHEADALDCITHRMTLQDGRIVRMEQRAHAPT
jgi:molybdate transport system ATP-binding protein